MIQPLKHKLTVNLYSWNNNKNLLENLENALETKFPSKLTVESLDLKAECAICYNYKLDDDIPDIVCDGHGCEKVLFHTFNLTPFSSTPFSFIPQPLSFCVPVSNSFSRSFTRIACINGWRVPIQTGNHSEQLWVNVPIVKQK